MTYHSSYIDESCNTDIRYIAVVNLQAVQYVACIHDNNWWIKNICYFS